MRLLARLRVFSRGIETYGDAVEQARRQTFSGTPLRCLGWHTGCTYPQARGFLPKGERHDEYTLVLVLGHAAGSRRYAATALEAHVEPQFREWHSNGSLTAFVIFRQRNLCPSLLFV